MKTLERALDVHVGEWEYFAREVRTPRRLQGLKEMEAQEEGRGRTCQVQERGKLGTFLPSHSTCSCQGC